MTITNPTTVAPYITGSTKQSLCRVAFRVQSNSGAAFDNVIPAGAVTTSVRSSAGLYTMVVAGFASLGVLVSGHVSLLGAVTETGGVTGQIVSYTPSTGVLIINFHDTSADPAVADVLDNDWAMVDLLFAQDVNAEGTAAAIA